MTPIKGRPGVVALFGTPEIVEGKLLRVTMPDGKVLTGGQWESKFMTVITDIPGMSGKKLYVNKYIADALKEALAACVALGDGYKIRTLGCFSPRAARGSTLFSMHSFGLAFDINADTNPMKLPFTSDLPQAWIDVFESKGWTWGGRWKLPDPMHFQAPTVR